ncbi:hypothetical protein MUK42_37373 [Musa troglodytarum]|uniref:Uncharacterized protein n=1 Tax=Musa troglodytarum TaxID=320322 RepID=A0A9E7J9P8_9LILI|nr:hypothetical protein MUK42_37373 [Musa troglodytarum]
MKSSKMSNNMKEKHQSEYYSSQTEDDVPQHNLKRLRRGPSRNDATAVWTNEERAVSYRVGMSIEAFGAFQVALELLGSVLVDLIDGWIDHVGGCNEYKGTSPLASFEAPFH